ncbi:torsin-1A-interacting protein 2 isoform X3 [Sinocyclocheilus anshuiensis]|uniref:torsin-1A-interacting protein 2 isoform X3 n=1 Tax=Sinocyclocheilus anshuiensis TaxID=1608454 RepID=UPI0007B7A11A|nr:PREDICTED: torsin-1A-interacting protein 2-like isoform X3 [Sinocyclocheilus anshuiensis]
MANKGNNSEETGTLSCQLSDAMQQGTDSRSDPGHDTKEKSESSSEPEETQTEQTTQIPSSSETENHPHSGTEPNREVDGVKGSKPERKEEETGTLSCQLSDAMQQGTDSRSDPGHDTKEKSESSSEPEETQTGPSGDSLPEKAPNEDDEETGTLSCQLSDAMQQGTDSRSDPGHDTKEKSESSSEPEETQTEQTTPIPSSSETENHPHSGTEPNRKVDGEKGSKPERKEGPSGDSLPEKAPNEDDEETGTRSCQLSDAMQQGTDSRSDPGHDTKEKSESSSEPEETQTEQTTQIPGSSETENHPHSGTEPNREVDGVKGSKPERKEEKTTPISSSSETENHPHSGTEPNREVDGEKGSKPERKEESPLNIQKPEEEETASDIYEEDVERDENVQPQIIVQGNNKTFWTAAAVILFSALVCALYQHSPDSTPPIPNTVNVVDVFNQEMKKLETTFPNQHPELWRRSLIHLRRHLKTKNPTEPVSLILTSGHRAEKTLGCLALCLARAFSTAHNSSVLNINGKNKASQDSDQVKLDIDSELRKAFEGKKSAAVIQRFEELPPGSTLIFYRYCDHENAAYKDVFLAFTVMLDAEVEVPSNVSLGRVEEMVQEHIKQKFVSSDKSAMFNQMDVDKLGGLWSRISHLILPVAAEKKIEEQGCEDWDKSF